MANPPLLQGDKRGSELDADEDQPRFSCPDYNDRHTKSNPYLHPRPDHNDRHTRSSLHRMDENGQTATDRQNDKQYGTETGHNSREQTSHDTTKEHEGDESSPDIYSTADRRINSRLARDYEDMYYDNGPDRFSDPRMTKLLAQHGIAEDQDSNSSGDDNARNRRRKSINCEAGDFDSELGRKLRPLTEDLGSKEDSKDLEGLEIQ